MIAGNNMDYNASRRREDSSFCLKKFHRCERGDVSSATVKNMKRR